ncbi:MAG: glycosyltransferase family 2 protein, partial [Verrucomicrobiota bacterium]
AERIGAEYLSREETRDHKAGNINHALGHAQGDVVAIFDVDHIPEPDFLDRALGPLSDPKVGFVQLPLSHYNADESFVAGANAQRNDGFFGHIMPGLDGCGCVQAFGSNCVFRREALDAIGGYQTGLAEDLHTSMRLHAQGWSSSYVPHIAARGLEPETFHAFLRQQIKWARGLFDLLFTTYPRLFGPLNGQQRICYLWRLTCYLSGPVIALHLLGLLTILASGSHILMADASEYVRHALPLGAMIVAVEFMVSRIVPSRSKTGPPRGGLFLAIGTWPAYTHAFLTALFRRKMPFQDTPKTRPPGRVWPWMLPQLLIVLALMIIGGVRFSQGMIQGPWLPLATAMAVAAHIPMLHAWSREQKTYRGP